MAMKGSTHYDGYVALGCVIRGETTHYDTVANESARGLMDIAVAYAMPIGNGIITVENEAQAWARARATEQDKGGGAAVAALRMIALKARLGAK
jgi:6,7-dimethyl-8-ribityllumazine synthase